MIIDAIEFIDREHSSFRGLESCFTEKYFALISLIKSGRLTDDALIDFHSDIMTAISTAEDAIIQPLLDQSSREGMAEIFGRIKTKEPFTGKPGEVK